MGLLAGPPSGRVSEMLAADIDGLGRHLTEILNHNASALSLGARIYPDAHVHPRCASVPPLLRLTCLNTVHSLADRYKLGASTNTARLTHVERNSSFSVRSNDNFNGHLVPLPSTGSGRIEQAGGTPCAAVMPPGTSAKVADTQPRRTA